MPEDLLPETKGNASSQSAKPGLVLCCKDIGSHWPQSQYVQLQQILAERMAAHVVVTHDFNGDEASAAQIEQLVHAGSTRITFLPVSLLPLSAVGAVAHLHQWAAKQWKEVRFQIAPPFTWRDVSNWVSNSLIVEMKETGSKSEECSLILCGHGEDDPLLNADLARLTQLLYEQTDFFRIDSAFLRDVRPTLSEVLESVQHDPVKEIILVPWQLADSKLSQLKRVLSRYEVAQASQMRLAEISLSSPAIINLLSANFLEATPFEEIQQSNTSEADSSLSPAEQFELQELKQRIDAMLPREYQGVFESVSPRSMGTAKLKTDEDGRVAWDQIWTSFCDLALAGGPPHRGKLLEAVTAEEAKSEPAAYRAVVDEIRRGIQLVTPLKTFESPAFGWVGIQCDSEEMAVWLMRAIIVENVMVRREGNRLFLPAGPHFSVNKEIKNVITTIAKTVHYWSAHLKAQAKASF